ncbi:MAG: 2-deoxy-D-gluconate 3-dehydrogenase [Cyclobacteriaceae bacterium]|nr:MAG: 2-deoxy-D-gluconate 3-dehydrogenase [Cyclobacteriaceae bacterium]
MNEELPGLKQFDLTNRTAIITGGSKGLGLAMGAGLASAGCNLVLVSRNQQEGMEAADLIASRYNVQCIAVGADVTNPSEVKLMVETAYDKFGRIDILINSAGINVRGSIEELNYQDFQKVMAVNVDGTWLTSKAVVPYMKKAGNGKIINMASTLGLVGLANRTPYTSSKGAIVQMTRALGLELALDNINVNAICPGPFLTEINKSIANSEEAKKFIVGATALERWAELKEIQGAAILLASDAGSYMVGSMITVDGGWTAR